MKILSIPIKFIQITDSKFPTNKHDLKVTGNYLIKIFDEDDEIVFSRKFMVYENLANVGVQIKRSRDVRDVNTKQSVDFVINTTNFSFNNPKQTVNTVILQNNNLKTAISGLKPQYILGNELIYRYTTETSFWGGNEYLYFETKDVRGTNLGVQFTDLRRYIIVIYIWTATATTEATLTTQISMEIFKLPFWIETILRLKPIIRWYIFRF